MIEIIPAKTEDIRKLCEESFIPFKDGQNVFCLYENNALTSYCIFDELEKSIITASFSDTVKPFQTALIKAVLNHFDLAGAKVVTCNSNKLFDILKSIGFKDENGILSLDLTGYFTSPHC